MTPINTQFDDTAKESVRNAVNIVDVVGKYLTLKPSGSNFKGLCPFHKEKSPSFMVTPDKGIYHCFGCGKGGDVFSFLMEIENIGFRDALESLALQAGISLAPETRREGEQTSGELPAASKTEVLRLHELAAAFFYESLKSCDAAKQYFKSRGVSGEIAREFRLGYASAGWSAFTDYAMTKGYSMAALVAAGLSVKKSETSATAYDRFRDRIIFPIADATGRIIAFAGRGMTPDAVPKYLNSPETVLYKKNRVLYALHRARDAVKQTGFLLIVEGYMDHLALYQAGVRNVVASCGTALTPEHAQLLKRYTSRLVLLFDGDSAGVVAAQRAAVVLAPLDFDIKVLVLPDDNDPDEYIREFGVGRFTDILAEAQPVAEFLIGKAVESLTPDSPQAKTQIIKSIAPFLEALHNPITLQDAVMRLSQRLGIEEQHVYYHIKKALPSKGRAATVPLPAKSDEQTFSIQTLEGHFFTILVQMPNLIPEARQYVEPQTFTETFYTNVYSLIVAVYDADRSMAGLMGKSTSETMSSFLSALLAAPIAAQTAHDDLIHSIIRLQVKYLRQQIRIVRQQMITQPMQREELLQRLQQLSLRLTELDTQA